jgi:hypothetical protein
VAVGLGVDGAGEGAVGKRHLAGEEADRGARHPGRLGIARPRVLAGVELEQQRVVVEHLLEVRHPPGAVGGVAVEAAGELVEEAAAGHLVEGGGEHLAGARRLVPAAPGEIEQEEEVRRRGELGRRREAGPLGVEAPLEGGEAGGDHLRARRRLPRLRAILEVAAQRRRQLLGLLRHLVAAVPPGVGQAGEQALEARPAVAVLGREVGAGVEGLQVGRQEDRVGPAALPGQDLRGGHVDLVEVGPLLAVELDVDELAFISAAVVARRRRSSRAP